MWRRIKMSQQRPQLQTTQKDLIVQKYQGQLSQYEQSQKEVAEWKQATTFYERGIAPTQVRSGAPSIASKLALLYKEESQARQAQFRAQQKLQSVSTPKIPEGYQGVSTAEGVMLEKIPQPIPKGQTSFKESELRKTLEKRDPRFAKTYVEERQIDTYKTPSGKLVPVTQIQEVKPYEVLGRKPATYEQQREFREQQKVLIASEKPITKPQIVKEKVYGAYEKYKEKELEIGRGTIKPITRPIRKGAELIIDISPSPLGMRKEQRIGFAEAQKGIVSGIIKDIETRPLKNLALVVAGVATGFVSKGVVGVAGKLGRIPKLATSAGLTTAGLGLTGIYAYGVGRKAIKTKGIGAKAEIIGVATKDITLLGYGGLKGSQAYTKVSGVLRTKGLKEVPFKDLSPDYLKESKFPRYKKGETPEQLSERFLKQALPGEKKGVYRGFTATDMPKLATQKEIPAGRYIKIKEGKAKTDVLTGEKLAGKETLKSELPGRYLADVPSPEFLRSGGESDKTKLFSFFEDIGGEPTLIRTTLKDIRTPKTDAGKLSRSPERILELQNLLGGRRGLTKTEIESMIPELKPSEAVVPGIKSEREIIQVKGLTDDVITKKYYTREPKTGTRVPIYQRVPKDLLDKEIKSTSLKTKKQLGKREQSKLSKEIERAYSEPLSKSKSYITPVRTAGGILSSLSEPKTNKYISSATYIKEPISKPSIISKVSKPSATKKYLNEISEPTKYLKESKVSKSSITSKIDSGIKEYYGRTKRRTTYPITITKRKERPKRLGRRVETYGVQIKKKGKYIPIAKDLTRGEATKLLSTRLKRDIARTGKIVKLDKKKDVYGLEKEYFPSKQVFRQYKIRKGKKVPIVDEYIQLTSANLKSSQERTQLAESRRLKKLMKM